MLGAIFKKLKLIHKNIYSIGFISFLMQFGSSLVYSTSNSSVARILLGNNFVVLRSISESVPNLTKIVSGVISDKIRRRKSFLMLGYGSIIIFKLVLTFTSLTQYFPIWFLAPIFFGANFLDRMMNSLRDAPRDALIADSSDPSQRGLSFGIKKGLGAIGSVVGGGIALFLMIKKLNVSVIFSLSLVPITLAPIFLYWIVKDIQEPVVLESHGSNSVVRPVLKFFGLFLILFPSLYFGLNYIFDLKIISLCACLSWSLSLYLINFVSDWFLDAFKFFAKIVEFALFLISCLFVGESLFSGYLFYIFTFGIGLSSIYFFQKDWEMDFNIKNFTVAALLSFAIFFSTPVSFPILVPACFGFIYPIVLKMSQKGIFQEIADNKDNLKSFWYVVFLAGFATIARHNDAVFFNRASEFGVQFAEMKMFLFLYIGVTLSSIFFSKLLDRKNDKVALAISLTSLGLANLVLGISTSFLHVTLAIFLLSIYHCGSDSVISSVASYTIPKNLRGTAFGILQTTTGILSIFNALLFTTLKNKYGFSFICKFSGFLPIIALIFIVKINAQKKPH